jgi:hypothetical protein
MPNKELRKLGVTKKMYDSCLAGVGEGYNAYAVCNEALKHHKKKGSK